MLSNPAASLAEHPWPSWRVCGNSPARRGVLEGLSCRCRWSGRASRPSSSCAIQATGALEEAGIGPTTARGPHYAIVPTMLPDLTENSCRSGKWKQALEKERSAPEVLCLGNQASVDGQSGFLRGRASVDDVSEDRRTKLGPAAPGFRCPSRVSSSAGGHSSKGGCRKVCSVLDLMVLVNSGGASSRRPWLCNGLATRFHCDRVSLGWLVNGYVRLKAMSRTERFDKNMDAVKSLEMVMEESLDQNAEILGRSDGSRLSPKTMKRLRATRHRGISARCLFGGRQAVAVLTANAGARPFRRPIWSIRSGLRSAIPVWRT